MHACILLDQTQLSQPETYLFNKYKQLLTSLHLWDATPGEKSYNLLLTSRWMFVVPRSHETYGYILPATHSSDLTALPFYSPCPPSPPLLLFFSPTSLPFSLIWALMLVNYISELTWILGLITREITRGSPNTKRFWAYDYSQPCYISLLITVNFNLF